MLASVEAEAEWAAASICEQGNEVTFDLPPPENGPTFFILDIPLDGSTTSRMRLLRQLQAHG
jgi:hypothetical protein